MSVPFIALLVCYTFERIGSCEIEEETQRHKGRERKLNRQGHTVVPEAF